jgi:hypothetical protein
MTTARAIIDQHTSEKEFMEQVIACARWHAWLVYHPWDSRRSASGYPDLTLVHRGQRRLIFAELKREDGNLSIAQQGWRDALTAYGADFRIWRPSLWESEIEPTLRGAAG